MTHNYISRLDIVGGTIHTYRSNTIIFDNRELSQLIVPGLLHELKVQSKYPEMFINIMTSPSLYELPSYIIADKLTHELRSLLATSLLFIHVWASENHYVDDNLRNIIDFSYLSYEDFFNDILKFIINTESRSEIRNIAIDLKRSLRKIFPYLGVFHGNLKHIVHKTSDIISAVSTIICLSCVSHAI